MITAPTMSGHRAVPQGHDVEQLGAVGRVLDADPPGRGVAARTGGEHVAARVQAEVVPVQAVQLLSRTLHRDGGTYGTLGAARSAAFAIERATGCAVLIVTVRP